MISGVINIDSPYHVLCQTCKPGSKVKIKTELEQLSSTKQKQGKSKAIYIDPARPGRVHVFFKEVYLGPPIFQKLNWCFPAKRDVVLCFSVVFFYLRRNQIYLFLMSIK